MKINLAAMAVALTAVLAALVAYPEARLAVADALEQLDGAQKQKGGEHDGTGR